jgi:hypothetical protein
VRLDRLEVIARIDAIINDAAAEHERAYQAKLADWEKRRETWRRDTAPALADELRRCAALVRKGIYPDTDLIDRSYSKHEAAWGRMEDRPEFKPYKPNPKLVSLRELLSKAALDDHVTTAMLREFGFQPSLFMPS